MIAKNPCIVKSRSYQQAWEECCRLFEIGIELAFTEQLYPKRSFAHFCNENNKCQRCQNKETYKNKCGKIETIEEEILRRYNTNRKKSYEYTSSSEDDKLFNNYDLFMNRVEKKCRVESNKDLSVPFESNNDMMMMEISSDEIKSRKQSDNYDFLEHSPTIDIVDSKGFKLSLTNNSFSRQSQQSQSLKKSKLKEFQFKFTKRENIDKKILRKFRKFLKEQYKKNQINVINILSNNKFWSDFVSLNLLPPFSYIIEEKEFKSFNTGYMCWVFEHPNSIELYNIFIKPNYQYLINHFETKYHLNQNDDEYNQLKTYINTLAVVFGTGQANESTTISDNTDFLFESNPKHIMSEDIEGEENYSVNRFNWNYISLHPQMPDIFNELINNNRKTLYSKSFGGKQNDSMSDESIEYGGNKEEFDSDSN